MRAGFAIPLLMLMALPNLARSASPGISPAISTDRNEARWAEWEAQARMTDGDYEGAVQAQKQADAARTKADRQEARVQSAAQPSVAAPPGDSSHDATDRKPGH